VVFRPFDVESFSLFSTTLLHGVKIQLDTGEEECLYETAERAGDVFSGSYMVAEEGANLNAWNGVFDFKAGGILRTCTRPTLHLLPLLLHGVLRTSTRPTLNLLLLLLLRGVLRTSTRPTLNLLLLLRASV